MERKQSRGIGRQFAFQLLPSKGRTALAAEYAKCKNRLYDFTVEVWAVWRRVETDGPVPRLELAMTNDLSGHEMSAPELERKPLSPAAKRALAEAEARRQAAVAKAKPVAEEFQGPKGPEPTRYGYWENKGIASDF
jgi:hypothetical protein